MIKCLSLSFVCLRVQIVNNVQVTTDMTHYMDAFRDIAKEQTKDEPAEMFDSWMTNLLKQEGGIFKNYLNERLHPDHSKKFMEDPADVPNLFQDTHRVKRGREHIVLKWQVASWWLVKNKVAWSVIFWSNL